MSTSPERPANPGRPARRPYRPPLGVPAGRKARWGLPLSVLAHVLLIVLLASPAARRLLVNDMPRGAGGLGPMGGGGGGGAPPPPAERLHFIAVAPAPPPVARPEVPRPVPVQPRVQPVQRDTVVAPPPVLTVAAGTGTSGTGSDSGRGAGPGTGGGTGTGTGPGRGSAMGPGTGGGEGTIYPATPDFLVIPSLPIPKRIRGHTIMVRFTLDSAGTVLKVESDPSGDDGYDRELRSRLAEYRFRPAHRIDGTPVASVYVTQLTL